MTDSHIVLNSATQCPNSQYQPNYHQITLNTLDGLYFLKDAKYRIQSINMAANIC